MLLLGVISKIKQNSSDMNEIILVPCDAGYVQNCTGCVFNYFAQSEHFLPSAFCGLLRKQFFIKVKNGC
jgi:hypothetical protein